MAKITITDILSENGLLNAINSRFDLVEYALNSEVLYRDNPVGEANEMLDLLDMNNNRIINLPAPIDPNEAARKQDVDGVVAGIFAHDLLTGLGDDDHPQYHNDARGDARYLRNTNAPFSNGAILFGDVNGNVEEHPSTLYRNPLDGYVGVGYDSPVAPLHVRKVGAHGRVARLEANADAAAEYVGIELADYTSAAVDSEIRSVWKSINSSNLELYNKIAGVKTKSLEIDETGKTILTGGLMTGGIIATGNEASPDVGAGGLCLNIANLGTTGVISAKGSTVAHGITLQAETDTFFRAVQTSSFGGMDILGISGSDVGFRFFGMVTTENTGINQAAPLNFISYLKSGTNVTSLSAAGNVALFRNGATVISQLKGNGTQHFDGSVVTGGEDTPDVDLGGICINTGAADGFAETLKNSDVAHGVTAVAETDTYSARGKFDAASGGVQSIGISEGTTGLQEYGIVTTDTATFTTPAAVSLRGALKSGTGVTSQAATANVVNVINNTTLLAAFKGGGNLELLGGIKLSNAGTVLANYEEGTWTPVIADASSGGNVATFTNNGAVYTRIGREVRVRLFASSITTTGMTAGNNVFIRGLPFTVATGALSIGDCRTSNVTYAGELGSMSAAASTHLNIFNTSSGGAAANINVSALTSGTAQIILDITYHI